MSNTQTGSRPAQKLRSVDPIWSSARDEAVAMATAEPDLASFLHAAILNHDRLEGALSFHLAQKLGSSDVTPMLLRQVIDQAFSENDDISSAIRADIAAINDRDPAARSYLKPILYFKGFQALQTYRVAHWLWRQGRRGMAAFLQSRSSEVFGVDIHPAAQLGRGILIDHGTGVVIGETAVVENDVSLLQDVTLGGTGKAMGDRHPKIRRGVLIGAGAKILGNIEIGEGSKIGAGSVVLQSVPPHQTAAGVPARILGCPDCPEPSFLMDHSLTAHSATLDSEYSI